MTNLEQGKGVCLRGLGGMVRSLDYWQAMAAYNAERVVHARLQKKRRRAQSAAREAASALEAVSRLVRACGHRVVAAQEAVQRLCSHDWALDDGDVEGGPWMKECEVCGLRVLADEGDLIRGGALTVTCDSARKRVRGTPA